MRREELFNRSGYYRFLLDSNALMHREATDVATEALKPVLGKHAVDKPVRVLDLACGGWPKAIAGVMTQFSSRTFEYTGIDINPDQVKLAAGLFEFPGNVIGVLILEGNAWDLEALGISGGYDLIFSGMNLNYGNPAEFLFLARQLRALLAPCGILFSHDVHRPDAQLYRRRPDANPDDPAESFRLIDAARIASAALPPFGGPPGSGFHQRPKRATYKPIGARAVVLKMRSQVPSQHG